MTTTKFFQGLTFTAGIVSLAFTAAPSYAVQVNFSTWTKFGDVTIPAIGQANLSNDGLDSDDFPATNGTFSYSKTIPAGSGAGPLQTFLGVSASALDIGGFAYEGSAIKTTYLAQAGDKFTFNYNFLTNEGKNYPANSDFAFFVVNGAVNKLADVTNATNSSSPFFKETGFNSYSYTFLTAGNYNLAFGVVDVDDYGVTSALRLTNADVQPVPEPTTILGSLTALGFGAGMLRNRRKKVGARSSRP